MWKTNFSESTFLITNHFNHDTCSTPSFPFFWILYVICFQYQVTCTLILTQPWNAASSPGFPSGFEFGKALLSSRDNNHFNHYTCSIPSESSPFFSFIPSLPKFFWILYVVFFQYQVTCTLILTQPWNAASSPGFPSGFKFGKALLDSRVLGW